VLADNGHYRQPPNGKYVPSQALPLTPKPMVLNRFVLLLLPVSVDSRC
jgi:hypothetical protein